MGVLSCRALRKGFLLIDSFRAEHRFHPLPATKGDLRPGLRQHFNLNDSEDVCREFS